MRLLIFTMFLLAFTTPRLFAAETPVVVELFTSQSCSSCPPADALLKDLAREPNIIALGCHVTYWDHLHWRDTLSQKFCTQRQRDYAGTRNTRRVYTPQMVVNGQAGFVGSRESQASSEIKKGQGQIATIHLSSENIGTIEIMLPDIPYQPNQTLWLFGYQKSHKQDIRAGENRGKSVEYVNVVLTLEKLDWDGQSRQFITSLPKSRKINGLAVILQDNTQGTIRAAGQLNL